MIKQHKYKKIIVLQYGKVGSTSLRCSLRGKYCYEKQRTYQEYIIQTHSHEIAEDILNKYKDVLIINIVRLPIDRNISAFYENINKLCPEYYKKSINEIIKIYDKNDKCCVKYTDKWMYDFFKMINLDINNFNFDKIKKYNILNHNNYDVLLFRYEDIEYIISDILPIYNIYVNEKINVSSKKFYSKTYNVHKKIYKINNNEKENIINSKIINIYYTNKEIQEHIKKYEL